MTALTLREILRHEESVLRPFLIGKRFGHLGDKWTVTICDIRWYDDALLLRLDGDAEGWMYKHEQRDSYPDEWCAIKSDNMEGAFVGWDRFLDGWGTVVDMMDILGDG